MRILVTGGAGYIGSHTCKALMQCGHSVTVYDNLSTGFRDLVRWGDFIHGDIRDTHALHAALVRGRIEGVIHFASAIAVGESVQKPDMYYDINVSGSLSLMQAVCSAHVPYVVVSGSAAVYGLPETLPVAETAPCIPINPYGRTKLIMEWMLEDTRRAFGLQYISLRYFNAAGADADGETGECHEPETHLIPNVLRAVRGRIPALRLFGEDYATPDGTCVRDYIHVQDLAHAHVLAMEYLARGGDACALNVGTGQGYSVREIVQMARQVTGKDVPYMVEARREGDPAVLVADVTKARDILGFHAACGLEAMVHSAWAWECSRKEYPLPSP